MPRLVVAPRADADLGEIWSFIAQDNPPPADAVLENLQASFSLLAEFPAMGRAREDMGTGRRSFPVGDYVIVYRPAKEGVRILRVVSGFRDLSRLR